MTGSKLVFAAGHGGRVEIAAGAVDGSAAGLRLRVVQGHVRVEASDRFDTDTLDGLWTRLGESGAGVAETLRLTGHAGRIDLTLRFVDDAVGLRAVLRPASGVRVEVELEVEPQPEAWRTVLSAWLRDRAATDLDLPGL